MAYDERWLRQLPLEAELAARRLRGLGHLCLAWAEYRAAAGDPGAEGEALVMGTVSWALDELAASLQPAPAELPAADRAGQ